jgi:hypothetical protein
MTKREKRLEKIRQNPKNVHFEDLDQVLQDYGFERRQPRSGSSHYVYVCGDYQLTVPYKRPFLKAHYIQEALSLLDKVIEGSKDEEEKSE